MGVGVREEGERQGASEGGEERAEQVSERADVCVCERAWGSLLGEGSSGGWAREEGTSKWLHVQVVRSKERASKEGLG